ncbi:hypothetical protein DAPPUDRAFT_250492 [Daphnia pulex]|uniref:Uncharacterized protein n=1 Tax=Daphnia pulex TaxID=6669 RepID=E9GYP1_DAPPU|nr:hypothetical protein DAPPUDRAFT_250492 [Daphnia pulex]|eukprot:EFX75432.1 hypothetical protein DAPPUDRAFT_250492 [Daphnia pulex]
MSSSLRTPEPFSFGASDLAAQWGIWRKQFSWYLVATNSGLNVDEEQMVGVLITLLGSEGLKIYETFVFNPATDAIKIQSRPGARKLRESRIHHSELSMSSSRPLINTQPSSIPSAKIAVVPIEKISVGSPMLRVLIATWSAMYLVAVRIHPSPARCRHVKHQAPRPKFML